MEELAKKIVSLLDADGRPDVEIENDLGLPRSTIYDWRNGRSKSYRKYIEKISTFYKVNLFQSLGGQKNKPATHRDELNPEDREIMDKLKLLNPGNRNSALALIDSLLENQDKH